jgi:cyclohexadienyl dehydratase
MGLPAQFADYRIKTLYISSGQNRPAWNPPHRPIGIPAYFDILSAKTSMRFLLPLRSRLVILCALLGSAPTGAIAADAPRLERIRQAHLLRVCIWPDYYGISFRNPKTRLLSGLDIDIAGEFGRELGVAITYVDSSFPQLEDKLLRDECDIAMHAVGITPERSARLQFTQPYLRSDFYAVTSRSSGLIRNWDDLDRPGRVIAVLAGTRMEPVMRQRLKHASLMLVQPPRDRAQEVESGRADAFITDYAYSRRMLDLSDWARLVAPPTPFHPADYAYALAPGEASLLERMNQFLSTIKKDGRLLAFARRHKLDPIVVSD